MPESLYCRGLIPATSFYLKWKMLQNQFLCRLETGFTVLLDLVGEVESPKKTAFEKKLFNQISVVHHYYIRCFIVLQIQCRPQLSTTLYSADFLMVKIFAIRC